MLPCKNLYRQEKRDVKNYAHSSICEPHPCTTSMGFVIPLRDDVCIELKHFGALLKIPFSDLYFMIECHALRRRSRVPLLGILKVSELSIGAQPVPTLSQRLERPATTNGVADWGTAKNSTMAFLQLRSHRRTARETSPSALASFLKGRPAVLFWKHKNLMELIGRLVSLSSTSSCVHSEGESTRESSVLHRQISERQKRKRRKNEKKRRKAAGEIQRAAVTGNPRSRGLPLVETWASCRFSWISKWM